MDLTDADMEVLSEMMNDFMDKDRHAELEREYPEGFAEEFRSLYAKFSTEASRRKFWWAR